MQLLGDDCQSVFEEVLRGVEDAHRAARDAQDAGGLTKKTTYGGTFWLAVYEHLIDRFSGHDGFAKFHPHGAPYELVVLNGVLLYPVKVGDTVTTSVRDGRVDDRPIRKGIFDAARRQSINRGFDFEALTDDNGDEWVELPPIVPDGVASEIVIFPYISNAEAGVLAAGVGQGTLLATHNVAWEHYVDLDLDLYRAAPTGVEDDAETTRFDDAPLPNPMLGSRGGFVKNPEADDEAKGSASEKEEDGSGD
jgi:hypothetical protein